MFYGQENMTSNRDVLIQKGSAGTATVPVGAKLPAMGGNATEEGVQKWSKDKYGTPIVGLVPLVSNLLAQVIQPGDPMATSYAYPAFSDEGIKQFQKLKGLTVDGIIGKQTYAALGITGFDVEYKFKVPFVPAPVDVGGAWYQSSYVVYGGLAALLVGIGYGVYRLSR